MGNQLTAIAPSQILPVEQYLSEGPNFHFVSSLGSTRFFKVAKVLSKEGLIIVKVFVVHDPSLDLKGYKAQIEKMRSSLNWVLNCSPFHSIIHTDKAVMICRRFVDYSLYDRISTKPFLTLVEKKWIAFLLLNALNQCHKLNIFHGDIKSENVLITSWNWVLLADFANFKPIFLPDNNPADFSYYFDTSNRRACYIAPERFVETNSESLESKLSAMSSDPLYNGELTPAMDVFSAGCVLIELFTEGDVAFDLSQLLAYRAGEYYPHKLIDLIKDNGIKRLVEQMIKKDPQSRLGIDRYLIDHKATTFPELFYVFLKPYIQRFASSPFLNADERISRIKRDFDLISQKIDCYSKGKRDKINDGFLIVLPIVISSINKLQLVESKLQALNLLCSFSLYLSSDIILDRVIPSILSFANDKFPIIRCEMLRAVKFCFSRANSISSYDSKLFTEYIFPSINHLASDNDSAVRIDFAQDVASFAEHARRSLELIQHHNIAESDKGPNGSEAQEVLTSQSYFDIEFQSLQDFIHQKVVQLLGDRENCVRRTLLASGLETLCNFFGKKKTCDFIFSHMITFLNDKYDWQLRASFFNNVIGVITYLGWSCSSILKPLLQQGISDAEEFNVVNSLSCLGTFVELNLLQKYVIIELLNNALPLLFHPNVWIRKEVVWLLTKLSKTLDWVDQQCYIIPSLSSYMTSEVRLISHATVLLSSLSPPLPLQIYRQLARSPIPLGIFLEFLGKHSSSLQGIETSEENAILLKKLISQGMTEIDKVKIMAMASHLKGLYRYKIHDVSNLNTLVGSERNKARIDLLDCLATVDLCKHHHYKPNVLLLDTSTLPKAKAVNKRLKNNDQLMNEDWKYMFGPEPNVPDKIFEVTRKDDQSCLAPSSSDNSESRKKCSTDSLVRPITAPNKAKLESLLAKYSEHYSMERVSFGSLTEQDWKESSSSQEWRPQGIMVAHLHEHRGAVNRLCASSDGMFFATCSNDSSVKLWDTTRLDGKSITNRSRMTYSKQPGQLKSLCFCDRSRSLASASDMGTIHLFRIDSKSDPFLVKELDASETGTIVDMTTCDMGSENVIALATSRGKILGWDIRASSKYSWKVEMDYALGFVTAFDVHKQLGWFAVGTCHGVHVCWDMRFLLPTNSFVHPNAARVRQLAVDKNAQCVALSSSHCNNELTIFDLETSTRQKSLWASPTPVLGYDQSTKHYYRGIHAGSSYVITAGSDMRIRYWDLKMPRESYIIVGGANDQRNVGSKVSYHSKLIEATAVIYEAYETKNTAIDDMREEFSDGHRNIITDLVVCSSSQQYIVTSSYDGIVKVWK